jgi:hypothetical protein
MNCSAKAFATVAVGGVGRYGIDGDDVGEDSEVDRDHSLQAGVVMSVPRVSSRLLLPAPASRAQQHKDLAVLVVLEKC